jgi:myosin-18
MTCVPASMGSTRSDPPLSLTALGDTAQKRPQGPRMDAARPRGSEPVPSPDCPPATVLRPDEGTADLPTGRVRLCLDADRTVTEVDEDLVHRVSVPPLPRSPDTPPHPERGSRARWGGAGPRGPMASP